MSGNSRGMAVPAMDDGNHGRDARATKRFAEDQFKRSEATCRLTPVLSIPDTVSCFGDKLDGPMR